MCAAQSGWCHAVCAAWAKFNIRRRSLHTGKHMTTKRQSSTGCGIGSLDQTSLRQELWLAEQRIELAQTVSFHLHSLGHSSFLGLTHTRACFFSRLHFPFDSFVDPSFPAYVDTIYHVPLLHTHRYGKRKEEKKLNNIDSAWMNDYLWADAVADGSLFPSQWLTVSNGYGREMESCSREEEWLAGWITGAGGRKTSPFLVSLVLLCLRRLCLETRFVCTA